MDEPDERAVRDVCAAAVLRNLGRFPEARTKLQSVLDMDRYVLTQPFYFYSYYEVLTWSER